MSVLRKYLAKIGRRGGIKSRRVLDADTARRMVRIREARRAARMAINAGRSRHFGIPADTSVASQSMQDALWRRLSPEKKLQQVARLSRMVDALSIEGVRQRNPADNDLAIRRRRADIRLGTELAERVYGSGRDHA
jgi:hypothetical protein